jgi:signal transduction histidine kinase
LVRDLNTQIKRSEEASRVKSTFLAMVSHEMRTPLQGILGHSELLLNSDVRLQNSPRCNSFRIQR